MFHGINAKFLRTPILISICEWLLLKIYLVLPFRFLEDVSEVAYQVKVYKGLGISGSGSRVLVLVLEEASLKAWNFIKKSLQHRCFTVNIAKVLITASFIEHLRRLNLIAAFCLICLSLFQLSCQWPNTEEVGRRCS